ncbi:MAG: HNH endonuclease [Muribaculaceae bacterium]|nr:HNH endonuclease [Muribaculaceae bacterium]
MARDKDYNRMIQSARWLRLRRQVITEHPICQDCQARGELSPSVEVHHVTPVEYGLNPSEKERLMFNRANLRALCHRCHVEQHRAMGRSGRAATRRR